MVEKLAKANDRLQLTDNRKFSEATLKVIADDKSYLEMGRDCSISILSRQSVSHRYTCSNPKQHDQTQYKSSEHLSGNYLNLYSAK